MKGISKNFFEVFSISACLIGLSTEALAGTVPAPIVGATGPYGIAAAALGYGGYKAYKYIKSKRK